MKAVDITMHTATVYVRTRSLELPAGSRGAVIEFLERLMVDEDALALYAALELFPDLKDSEPGTTLTSEQETAILQREWDSLPDHTLAELLLSPRILQRLGRRVWDELPLSWFAVLDRIGERIDERIAILNSDK